MNLLPTGQRMTHMIKKVYRHVYWGIRQASEGVSLARKFIEHKFRGRHKVMDREIKLTELEMILRGINGNGANLQGKGAMFDRYNFHGASGYELLLTLRSDFYPPMGDMFDEDGEKYRVGVRYRVYKGDHNDKHVIDLGCYVSKKKRDGGEKKRDYF